MGLNAYLEAAVGIGLTQNTTALANQVFISGKSGKRISVLAYGATTPSVATNIYFMVPVSGVNSIATAMTAAATAFVASATAAWRPGSRRGGWAPCGSTCSCRPRRARARTRADMRGIRLLGQRLVA